MRQKAILIAVFLMQGIIVFSRQVPLDTIPASKSAPVDTSFDYESLFQDFDEFMDSILAPHSYFLGSLSVGKGYFNFERKGSYLLETAKKLTYSPTIGYYHKSGLGLSGIGYIINDGENANFYQFSLSPSFDYLNNRNFAAGISYTRFITRDSLPFYTSPLENELYGYFTYRKWWFRPSVAVSYGWGSRSDYNQREEQIQSLRLRPRGFTFINTTESIADFSITASVRHDFYWLDVLARNDHIRLTPQLAFTSGTQKFGFNQSSNTYATTLRNGANVLFSSQDVFLDDQTDFQPLSLTFYLRGEYSIGKFFLQPQLMMDYYFPATTDYFNVLVSVNVGVMF